MSETKTISVDATALPLEAVRIYVGASTTPAPAAIFAAGQLPATITLAIERLRATYALVADSKTIDAATEDDWLTVTEQLYSLAPGALRGFPETTDRPLPARSFTADALARQIVKASAALFDRSTWSRAALTKAGAVDAATAVVTKCADLEDRRLFLTLGAAIEGETAIDVARRRVAALPTAMLSQLIAVVRPTDRDAMVAALTKCTKFAPDPTLTSEELAALCARCGITVAAVGDTPTSAEYTAALQAYINSLLAA